MARTIRTYWDHEGNLTNEHRDGKTGWIYSPRTTERAAKRTERAEAVRAAWDELVDLTND